MSIWSPLLIPFASQAVQRGTPIALAALGEGIAERSGVINLGVEGMMLVGALAGFVIQQKTGNPLYAVIGAGLAGATLACIHAALVLRCGANQIVSGFAITILGTGLSGFLGQSYVGANITGVGKSPLPGLSHLPVLGAIFFNQDLFVYLAVIVTVLTWVLFNRTRLGLKIRAVGEDPESAFAQGVPVLRTRFVAIIAGGFLAGIGGAQLSIATLQVWAEKMTSGIGWIAVGLVIVARWQPFPTLLTAWLFGAMLVLNPYLQGSGMEVSSYLIGMLPFLMAVAALVAVTLFSRRTGRGMPAALARELNLPE
jgi:general nucleoside transport system permease protein